MHEYGLIGALVARVEQTAHAHAGARVMRLHLRIGAESGVNIGLLRSAYETFTAGTVCADTELHIVPVSVTWCCPTCGEPIEPRQYLKCPVCDVPARLETGDEIILDRIEMEVGHV